MARVADEDQLAGEKDATAQRVTSLEAEVNALQHALLRITSKNRDLDDEVDAARIELEDIKPAEIDLPLDIDAQEEMIRKVSSGSKEKKEGEAQGDQAAKPEDNPYLSLKPDANEDIVVGSALGFNVVLQVITYVIAFGGVVFVLLAKSQELGGKGAYAPACGDAAHRRLGGGPSLLMTNIAYCVTGVGIVTFALNFLKVPLLVGYVLAGVLVGPEILNIVHGHEQVEEISTLGLIFLLFMIGLELDIAGLLESGKNVSVSGFFQFPVCAAIMVAVFMSLESAGFSFGEGSYSSLYTGICCSFSSTVIVMKLLADNAEMGTDTGKLTVGILICQNLWFMVVLAVMPDFHKPHFHIIAQTIGWVAVLIIVAMSYAKFILPVVFQKTSGNVELMMVLALSWCFLMGCFATLPFVELSMELAALLSGVALASFSFSTEFNAKIKYIRDFFITLFFVELGMQIPPPTFEHVGKAVLVALGVLAVRWVGTFGVIWAVGGQTPPVRHGAIATLNLSQMGESALVLIHVGQKLGHIKNDTLTILLWAFFLLAITSTLSFPYNHKIFARLNKMLHKVFGLSGTHGDSADAHEDEEGNRLADRNVVLLGFHKVAALLITGFEQHAPQVLDKIHVVDFDEQMAGDIHRRGMTYSYGDMSDPEVLQHCHHANVNLVICSIPDVILHGVNNLQLLKNAKQVWPHADVIVTADNPKATATLYENGADYVIRMSKLSAEKLYEIMVEYSSHASHHHQVHEDMSLKEVFEKYKGMDEATKKKSEQEKA